MATTRIMPLHIGKGRTESQAVSDIIDYGVTVGPPTPSSFWQSASTSPPLDGSGERTM